MMTIAAASFFVLLGAVGASEDSNVRSIDGIPKLLWGGFDNYTDDLMVSSTLE